jgi:hypothetical protein
MPPVKTIPVVINVWLIIYADGAVRPKNVQQITVVSIQSDAGAM